MTEEGSPVLSVVVPAYHEASRIAESLHRIAEYLGSLPYESDLIVVDDGSDAAGHKAVEDALATLPADFQRQLMRHEVNRGKGAAVRTGCLAAPTYRPGAITSLICSQTRRKSGGWVAIVRQKSGTCSISLLLMMSS